MISHVMWIQGTSITLLGHFINTIQKESRTLAIKIANNFNCMTTKTVKILFKAFLGVNKSFLDSQVACFLLIDIKVGLVQHLHLVVDEHDSILFTSQLCATG